MTYHVTLSSAFFPPRDLNQSTTVTLQVSGYLLLLNNFFFHLSTYCRSYFNHLIHLFIANYLLLTVVGQLSQHLTLTFEPTYISNISFTFWLLRFKIFQQRFQILKQVYFNNISFYSTSFWHISFFSFSNCPWAVGPSVLLKWSLLILRF